MSGQQASPVASGGLFKTKFRRTMYLTGAGAVGIAMLGFGIHGVMNERPLDDKPVDTGSSDIKQVTMGPPEVERPPAPVVQPPPPASLPPDIFQKAADPPPVVKTVEIPVFVRFPKSGAEASFDVAPPVPRDDKAAAATASQQASAKEAALEALRTKVDFKPSTMLGGKAGRAMRLDYVMMPQNIQCVLDTAMDSTLAGSVLCHLAHDVLAPSHITLMHAGDMVVGTYKNDIRNGQTRLFSFAGSAFTSEGIPVPLDSQMGDGFGRNGIPGNVDNHLRERFGASLALTAAQSVVSIAEAALSKGGNGGNSYFNLNQGGSGAGPQELATEILRKQIDIPPTITVPPGSIVSIIIDHLIDFSDALHVTTKD